jgi:hypothetical protein
MRLIQFITFLQAALHVSVVDTHPQQILSVPTTYFGWAGDSRASKIT